jgi:hypothetical protein
MSEADTKLHRNYGFGSFFNTTSGKGKLSALYRL